jgi:preprotein translocase subunit YajC
MNLLFVVLFGGQPATGTSGGGSSIWQTVIMFALIAVVFYLFFIRPQSKRNKDLRKFRENLKRGDKIITAGGIHGRVLEVFDTTVIIETEGQGKLKIEKISIASTVASDQPSS